jgi:APA family basic amino acid/polyamine antiporter
MGALFGGSRTLIAPNLPDSPRFPRFMSAQISLLSSVFLVIASMLGSGILTTTGSILGLVKSPGAVMLVWLVAGAHAVLGAYCYGIIVRRIPSNGGEASILRAYFSPALGEIAGWVSFIVGFAASNAASAIGFGAYLQKVNLLPMSIFADGKGAALCAIVLVTLLHSSTGPLGIRIQTGMAALKFAMLSGLALWALSHASPGISAAEASAPPAAAFGPTWGLAIMFSMFAYLGWSAAIYSAAETREARRTVPKAMLAGTLIVLLLYAGVNLALLKHIPLPELAAEKAVIELLVRKLFGSEASSVFSAFVAFALLSSLGASAFLGPRVLQSMLSWYRSPDAPSPARDSLLAPGVRPGAVWMQALLSMGMILSGTFEQILTVTGFLLGIFPILAVIGLYTPTANHPEKVPSAARWFAGPVFLAGSLLILTLGALEKPVEMGVATAAITVIFLLRHQTRRHSSASFF